MFLLRTVVHLEVLDELVRLRCRLVLFTSCKEQGCSCVLLELRQQQLRHVHHYALCSKSFLSFIHTFHAARSSLLLQVMGTFLLHRGV